MNKYEIVLFIWLSLLTIGFSFILFEMLDRTKKLKDAINDLDMSINPQLRRIRTLILDEILSEQKSRTGHWIYTLEDWNKWECSECGFTKRTDVHISIGYNYCPNCGAKMIKEGGNRH